MKLFTVDKLQFDTKKEACSYAKTASLMYAHLYITVRYDGFAVETFRQGRKVK